MPAETIVKLEPTSTDAPVRGNHQRIELAAQPIRAAIALVRDRARLTALLHSAQWQPSLE